MKTLARHWLALSRWLMLPLALAGAAAPALANTLTQNVSWTIDRAGTSTTYRLVAYGDSIFAGYNGSVLNADIESVRRAKSGTVASDV